MAQWFVSACWADASGTLTPCSDSAAELRDAAKALSVTVFYCLFLSENVRSSRPTSPLFEPGPGRSAAAFHLKTKPLFLLGVLCFCEAFSSPPLIIPSCQLVGHAVAGHLLTADSLKTACIIHCF